jgi:N-methylhydantoinase A
VDGVAEAGGHGRLRTIVHGTTVATNAILERKGVATALLTTRGFRDVLELQHQDRTDIWDLFYRKPEPLVSRDQRFEVDERISAQGHVFQPIAHDGPFSIEAASQAVRMAGVRSVAICLLNSYLNDEHEVILEAALQANDGLHVSRSSFVAPQFREYDRMSTTVLNAYVAPILSLYLRDLAERLKQIGFTGDVLVMQSHGGVSPMLHAAKLAASTCLSGPAGGVLASLAVAKRVGLGDFISIDMGGTSTDVSLVTRVAP